VLTGKVLLVHAILAVIGTLLVISSVDTLDAGGRYPG